MKWTTQVLADIYWLEDQPECEEKKHILAILDACSASTPEQYGKFHHEALHGQRDD